MDKYCEECNREKLATNSKEWLQCEDCALIICEDCLLHKLCYKGMHVVNQPIRDIKRVLDLVIKSKNIDPSPWKDRLSFNEFVDYGWFYVDLTKNHFICKLCKCVIDQGTDPYIYFNGSFSSVYLPKINRHALDHLEKYKILIFV